MKLQLITMAKVTYTGVKGIVLWLKLLIKNERYFSNCHKRTTYPPLLMRSTTEQCTSYRWYLFLLLQPTNLFPSSFQCSSSILLFFNTPLFLSSTLSSWSHGPDTILHLQSHVFSVEHLSFLAWCQVPCPEGGGEGRKECFTGIMEGYIALHLWGIENCLVLNDNIFWKEWMWYQSINSLQIKTSIYWAPTNVCRWEL